MIEKEFRELISGLNLNQVEKKEYLDFLSQIRNSIDNINNKNIKVLINNELLDIDYVFIGNKSINYFVSLEFKNKNLPLNLAIRIALNEIFDSVLLNCKGNIIDYKFNEEDLVIVYPNYEVHFYLYFKKENILKVSDNKSILNENYLAYKSYLKMMNKDYNRFYSCLSLINYYRKDLNISNTFNDYYIDSILLGYGMENYDSENNILDYLKNYCHAINDLLEGKTIILDDEVYDELKVRGTFIPEGNYLIIDITNKQNNLLSNNSESLKALKVLKSFLVSKFPKDGNIVSIDVTPSFVLKDKTIEWSFKINGTDIFNHGGEYDYDLDNYYSSVYKATLKAFQFIVKNKLGNNILVEVKNNSIFNLDDLFPNQLNKDDMSKLSYENQSRYANVLQYAKEFDLGVDFKIR